MDLICIGRQTDKTGNFKIAFNQTRGILVDPMCRGGDTNSESKLEIRGWKADCTTLTRNLSERNCLMP